MSTYHEHRESLARAPFLAVLLILALQLATAYVVLHFVVKYW